MKFQYNDGGRAAAGYKGKAGDCVTRAIAIATGKPYQEVYDALNIVVGVERAKRKGKQKIIRATSSSRTGMPRSVASVYLESIGWEWVPTMRFGSGCKVHLHDGELPDGRLIVRVSKHFTAVIDGVINDTHNPQRANHYIDSHGRLGVQRRCVYGYYRKKENK